MTDIKFEILTLIYESDKRQATREDLVNHYLNLGKLTLSQLAIQDLVSDNLLKYTNGKTTLALTPEGVRSFESEKQRRDYNAKQAADKAAEQCAQAAQIEKDKKQQFRHDIIVSIISTVFGSLITLLVEHSQEIVNAIIMLFS